MQVNEEIEIKIEYYDSFEMNPLCDCEGEKIMKENSFPKTRLEFKSQEEILDTEIEANDDLACEKDEPVVSLEPEIIVNWHKHVDECGKYVCRFCDHSYTTVQALRHHVRKKHAHNYNYIKDIPMSDKRRFKPKCHVCKMTFENTNDLQEHSLTHNLNNTHNSCLLCLATFEEHNDLLIHISNKHNTLKKLHICTTCGYSTSKLFNFKKHLDIHTGRNRRKCAHCPYTTNSQPNLKIHEQIHSNEKPYKCVIEDCEYRCKSQAALRSHRLIHDKQNHTLFCDKCSYSTVYKINLKRHIDSHQRIKLG